MQLQILKRVGLIAALSTAIMQGATFGKVVAIGGQGSDLVLDESRGVLYVANFTANRIEIVSLADLSISRSINVSRQPSSIALSPDNRFLVITHFGNFAQPTSSSNALTVIDLSTDSKQMFALGNPPLGVAFGIDGRALVVTTLDYLLFDPVTGTTQQIDTISGVMAKTLPVAPSTFPPQITSASVTSSGDGLKIFGIGGASNTFTFSYDVTSRSILPGSLVSSGGSLGPRVVSANHDGSLLMAAWAMLDSKGILNYVPHSTNQFNVGTTAFDSKRGLLYSQIPKKASEPPVLSISDIDNLTLREQLRLPENTAGKSVLSGDGMVMYSVSDSGVLVLPVGQLSRLPRVSPVQEDLIFRGTLCDRHVASQQLAITDPGGGSTSFNVSVATPGITLSPSSGVTPSTVTVTVDPTAFQGQNGTVTASLSVQSSQAVNIPRSVRILINSKSPDQRGTLMEVPGKLTDLLADPTRNRFYVISQDKNKVLVFDGSNYTQVAALRTGNLPVSMAITVDGRYLLVGNSGSQIVNVYDLETLSQLVPLYLPTGHIALSIACSSNAILAATQFFDGTHHIVRLDLNSRSGYQPASLGVFTNVTDSSVALVASPNGAAIFAAEGDGSVMLYDAVQDTFTASRKDFAALSGAYAASAFGQYLVGNNLLNASLVPVNQFETASGASSGFFFVDQTAFRTTVPVVSAAAGGVMVATGATSTSAGSSATPSSDPGIIQRLDLSSPQTTITRATRLAEAPLVGTNSADPSVFSRTLAVLYNRTSLINLTVSGFTVLAWDYDAAVAPPHLDSVVNAADLSSKLAPGALISLFGQHLSPVNIATNEVPLPTALGDSCLTVNGSPVPMIFVSPTQINAQLPFESIGNVTMLLRTPGGVSDNLNLTIVPGAPGVFRTSISGVEGSVPIVVRSANGGIVTNSNPIHRGDTVTIYLTGLGQTSPAVVTGQPSPSAPLALALNVPKISIGGMVVPLSFAGLSPGEIGVYQINARIPTSAPLGLNVPLEIAQASGSTSILLRVVD